MGKKLQEYAGEDLTVTYDPEVCTHAAECVRGLPAVFDPKAKPWVKMDGASPKEISEAVACCPSGALQVVGQEKASEDAAEAGDQAVGNSVKILADGPLEICGELSLTGGGGSHEAGEKIYLCRCGASENKPFCDGAHARIGFSDPGAIETPQIRGEASGSSPLKINIAANGPLVLQGSMELIGAERRCSGDRTALCRCGASENKPFCDGAHKAAGFEAP